MKSPLEELNAALQEIADHRANQERIRHTLETIEKFRDDYARRFKNAEAAVAAEIDKQIAGREHDVEGAQYRLRDLKEMVELDALRKERGHIAISNAEPKIFFAKNEAEQALAKVCNEIYASLIGDSAAVAHAKKLRPHLIDAYCVWLMNHDPGIGVIGGRVQWDSILLDLFPAPTEAELQGRPASDREKYKVRQFADFEASDVEV
jgi:hypothetical protein